MKVSLYYNPKLKVIMDIQLDDETVNQLMGGDGSTAAAAASTSAEKKGDDTTEVKPAELTDEAKKEIEDYGKALSQTEDTDAPEVIEEPKLDGVDEKIVKYIEALKVRASNPVKITEIPQEAKEALDRLKNYEANPVVKSFAEYVNSEGKIEDLFVNEGVNYDKLSDNEVVEKYFDHIYSSPEEKVKVPTAVKEFQDNNKLQYQRDMQIKNFRSELKASNPAGVPAKFQEVIGKHVSSVKQMAEAKNAQQRAINEKIQKASGELESKVKSLTEYNGIKIADPDKQDILKIASYHMPIKQEGTEKVLDVESGIDIALKLKYFNDIVKKARIEGYTDAKRGFHAPSIQPSSSTASAKKEISALDALKEFMPIESASIITAKQ